MAVGEIQPAVNTMIKAAKCNNLLTTDIENEAKKYVHEQSINNANQMKGNIFDLLRTSVIRKYTIVMWVNWLFCGLSFYGSSQYIGQLGGNVFLNIAMSAFCQVPAVLFCSWIINIWGRKTTLVVFNLICGAVLIISGINIYSDIN